MLGEEYKKLTALGSFFYKTNYNTFTNKILLVKQEICPETNIWILVYIDFINNTFEYGFLKEGLETIVKKEEYTDKDLLYRITNTSIDIEFIEAIETIIDLKLYLNIIKNES